MSYKYALVLLCGGSGVRSGLDYNKVLHRFGKLTAVEMCLESFRSASEIIIACRKEDIDTVNALALPYGAKVIEGGRTRQESAALAVSLVSDDLPLVAVHDGARPFVSKEIIDACLKDAEKYGSGVAAIPSTDTVTCAEGGFITMTLPREQVYLIQTPQVFDTARLKAAYKAATGSFTDDSQVYAAAKNKVRLSQGSTSNIKVTAAADFYSANECRVGIGYDIHVLTEGRRLILGGVTIPHPLGLAGHSDADALAHAVMDALLTAAGKSDIGCYFPDSDNRYKDADSLELLRQVVNMLKRDGLRANNLSACMICQSPKLNPHIPAMKRNLAGILEIGEEMIALSATTAEKLGLIGEGKGIAVSAVVSIRRM